MKVRDLLWRYRIHYWILLISLQRLSRQNNTFLSRLAAIINIFLIHCHDCIKHQHIKLDKTHHENISKFRSGQWDSPYLKQKLRMKTLKKIKKLESHYSPDPNFVFIGIMRKILIPDWVITQLNLHKQSRE